MNPIRYLRKKHNMSQLDLAKAVNVHQTAVSQWEQARTKPDIETAKNIAALFGVSLSQIFEESSVTESKGIKIPVLGYVRAGIPVEAVEEILDYEEITQEMAKSGDFFALKIKGNSMEPRMLDGDVVIVKRQSDVDSGDVAVVLVNGCDATVKKIKKTKEGILLIPFNTQYETMIYSGDEINELPVSIIGKVVEMRGKF